MSDYSVLAIVLAVALFALGIIGTIVPLMPGVILIWLGMLLYGILTGFQNLTPGFYIAQGVATLLVMAIDYFAAALGTKRFGGSRGAMLGAALGVVLGLLLLGPAGIIFGPFLGALAAELLKGHPVEKAFRSSLGALIGLLGGIFLKLAIEIVMIIWFFLRLAA